MLKGHVFDEQLFKSDIFAVFQNTFLEGHDGVISGFGNSMAVTVSGSSLTVQNGVVCIQGRFLQEDTNTTINAGTTENYARLVVEIDLDKVNTEAVFNQGYYKVITNPSEFPSLTQTDIVNNVSGIYQFPLGRFQITSNGIVNYVDERTYLDFTSIYGEISEHISAIDNEKIFMPIGSGCDYYGSELPNENYMWADGSEISRSEYAGLFAVIGTAYGSGDGSTTFNLPDKRERVTVMQKADGTFSALGQTGGEEKHSLTNKELARHGHQVRLWNNAGAGSTTPARTFNEEGNQTTTSFGLQIRNVDVNGVASSVWVGSGLVAAQGGQGDQAGSADYAGLGQGHNNLQPYLVCNYIIRVK